MPGWYEHEWRAYGYGFPAAGKRLDMLDEGIQIMRQLWTDGRATLAGEHYQVGGAICRPVPLQEDGIPLWVAGGGEKRNILDVFRRKSEILAAHCRDLGTDFDSITRSANYNVVVGASAAEVEDRLGRIADRYRRFAPADKVESSMKAFRQSPTVGTTEQVGEALQTPQDAGMTYAICYFPEAAHDTGNIELFEREVMSALR